jgi:hypothetical protein
MTTTGQEGTLSEQERMEQLLRAAVDLVSFYRDESLHELEPDEPNGDAHARQILGSDFVDAVDALAGPSRSRPQ